MTGFAALELFTVVPMAVALVRGHNLSRLINRVDATRDTDQQLEAQALQFGDELIWRLKNLIGSLEDGSAKAAGENALRTAQHAVHARRPLVTRRSQLEHLAAVAKSPRSASSFGTALSVCVEELDRLDTELDDLAASLAHLVDAASEDEVEREIQRVQEAEERVCALTAGFEEVDRTVQAQAPAVLPGQQAQA